MSWDKIFKKFGMLRMYREVFMWLDKRRISPQKVRPFLEEQVETAFNLYREGKLPTFKGTQDNKVLKIIKWINKEFKLKYKRDIDVWKTVELWQPIKVTLDLKTGDCEDGAILIYCLARVNKVNPLQITLNAGHAKGVGHCWTEYTPDEMYDYDEDTAIFYTIDWCYYPDYTPFNNRVPKNPIVYTKDWWALSVLKL